MPSPTRRNDKLGLRLSSAAKQKLEAAAKATYPPLRAFVLESALSRAGEVLANRQLFKLGPMRWEAFMAVLDAPARSLRRLERILPELHHERRTEFSAMSIRIPLRSPRPAGPRRWWTQSASTTRSI